MELVKKLLDIMASIRDPSLVKGSLEKNKRSNIEQASILDGIAYTLPVLKRSQKIQCRAARAGFDWPDIKPVFAKIEEEIEEVKQAMEEQDQAHIKEEVGDLFFACVNLAMHLNVDAEEALRDGNKKFEKRFNFIETKLAAQKKKMQQCNLDELEEIWQQAKQ